MIVNVIVNVYLTPPPVCVCGFLCVVFFFVSTFLIPLNDKKEKKNKNFFATGRQKL